MAVAADIVDQVVDQTVEQGVHARATRLPVAAIVGYLQGVLGARLTAFVAGEQDVEAVGQWARGDRMPYPAAEIRLRNAFQVVELLTQCEEADTVRAWFSGMNPYLGDAAPARVIGTEPAAVLTAARAFLSH